MLEISSAEGEEMQWASSNLLLLISHIGRSHSDDDELKPKWWAKPWNKWSRSVDMVLDVELPEPWWNPCGCLIDKEELISLERYMKEKYESCISTQWPFTFNSIFIEDSPNPSGRSILSFILRSKIRSVLNGALEMVYFSLQMPQVFSLSF